MSLSTQENKYIADIIIELRDKKNITDLILNLLLTTFTNVRCATKCVLDDFPIKKFTKIVKEFWRSTIVQVQMP